MHTPPPIRIGLLVDNGSLPAWAWTAIDLIKRQPQVRIVLVLVNDRPAPLSKTPWLHRLYRQLDNKVFSLKPDAFAQQDTSQLLSGIPQLGLLTVAEELEALPKLAAHQVDILLHLSLGPIKEALLKLPSLGLWTFQRGERAFCGDGVELAVLAGQATTSLELHCHGAEEQVLYRSPSACHALSAGRTRNRLYWKVSGALPRLLAQLHRLGPERFYAKFADKSQSLSPAPNNWALLKLFAGYLKRNLGRGLQKLSSYEQWGLLLNQAPRCQRKLANFTALQPPGDRLWADPFVLHREGTYYLFCEEMLFKQQKGRIALFELDGDLAVRGPTTILERPYHLSYPFLLDWQGELYMIPETHAKRTIEVYRCTNFPYRWEFHQYLMEDISASDATLHYHQGRWWLFANIVERPGIANRDELFLFYSEDPLSTTWIPHRQNPVVSDVSRARPAGPLFVENGQLMRPSQNSSRRYGYGLKINRILSLDPENYAEEEIESIEPDWDKNTVATHTLSRAHQLSAADAKVRRWHLARLLGR